MHSPYHGFSLESADHTPKFGFAEWWVGPLGQAGLLGGESPLQWWCGAGSSCNRSCANVCASHGLWVECVWSRPQVKILPCLPPRKLDVLLDGFSPILFLNRHLYVGLGGISFHFSFHLKISKKGYIYIYKYIYIHKYIFFFNESWDSVVSCSPRLFSGLWYSWRQVPKINCVFFKKTMICWWNTILEKHNCIQ